MTPSRKLVVPEGAPERLDRFLADALGMSRARIKKVIENGQVRVDGHRARKGDAIKAGTVVEIPEDAARVDGATEAPVPDPDQPLNELYSDGALLVLDKPPGVPTHPLEQGERGTLANALVARHPECAAASEDARECGLAHRLDTGTSGLIVAARTRPAFLALRASFRARKVEKRYVALVGGTLGDSGEIDIPLANDPKDRRRVVACASAEDAQRLSAEEAVTRYRVRARSEGFALVDVEIITGVRHQIRAHLAAIGAPVVGDDLYGGPPVAGLERPFLHAARIGFPHPDEERRVIVDSPLPADLQRCWDELRSHAGIGA